MRRISYPSPCGCRPDDAWIEVFQQDSATAVRVAPAVGVSRFAVSFSGWSDGQELHPATSVRAAPFSGSAGGGS